MFKSGIFSVILGGTLFLISCTNSEQAYNDEVSVEVNDEKELTKSVESPCQFVSEATIKSRFALADDMKVEMKDMVRTYPTCHFKWQDGKVVRKMDFGGTETEIKMDSEVMIVMVEKATESMFETSSKVYKDGVNQKVGEKAIWGDMMSQLTFLSKGYMFHVHVKASNDNEENRDNALALAKEIIAQL